MKTSTKLFFAALVIAITTGTSWAQDTLVKWTFPLGTTTAVADGGIAANLTKQIMTRGGTGAITYTSGGATTQSARTSGCDAGMGTKYWMISISTLGYQNIIVNSNQRSANLGPRDFTAQFTLDTLGAWTDIDTIRTANNFISGLFSNKALPASCNNQTAVYIRWIMRSDIAVNGAAVLNTGTTRIDDIIILGSLIPLSDDAGISASSSPSSITSVGVQSVIVSIKNFGINALTAVDIDWSVNGVGQPTFAWTGNLPSDSVASNVTIGAFSFPAGLSQVKVWALNPNAVSDLNHSNDTLIFSTYAQSFTPIPLIENFEAAWVNKTDIRDVPTTFWNNTPVTGNNSWRADNDGASAAWTVAAFGAYTPTGANTTLRSARFHSVTATAGSTGTLDLYADFSAAGTKILTGYFINTSGSDSLEVFFSTDGGTTFNRVASKINAAVWTKYTIDLGTTTSATCVIRFAATAQLGTTDLGLDEVAVSILSPDDAGITAITAPTSPMVSGNNNILVSIKNFGTDTLTSATINWSVAGVLQTPFSWTGSLLKDSVATGIDIGAYNFSASPVIVKVWTTAPNAGTDGDNTNDTTQVSLSVINYATIPYAENFDGTWINNLNTRDVPTIYWVNTPATGNTSWRSNADGAAATWTNPGSGAYTPVAANATLASARFHSRRATFGTTGTMDLYVNCSPTGTKALDYYYINTTSIADSMQVLFSTDGGTTFNRIDGHGTSGTGWTKYRVILGTTTSNSCVVRFNGYADGASSDIGIDEVAISILTPDDAGVIAITSPTNPLAAGTQNVLASLKNFGTATLTGATINWAVNGVAQTPYSWTGNLSTDSVQSGINIGSYNFISGAYAIRVWSSLPNGLADGLASNDTANKILYVQGYAPIPLTESFDGIWIDKFATRDVPTLFWNNNPATGESSFRRNDDGASASWANPTGGVYATTGALATTNSARFHTSGTVTGTTGIFNLFIDCSPAGDKSLDYYYINTGGSDSMRVSFSTDGGTTFNRIGGNITSAAWTLFTIPLGTTTSANCIVRFVAISNAGGSDIGLDEVSVNIINPNDAGIAAITAPVNPLTAGTQNVLVTIQNFGTATLTSDTINWFVNGVAQTPFTWTGSLVQSAVQAGVNIGSFNFVSGSYIIKAWTSAPNATTDANLANDTATTNLYIQGYATIPFAENFDGVWINKSDVRDVPSLFWSNIPATSDSSWRRDDDGAAAWTSTAAGYTPTGANSTANSARFHSWDAIAGTRGVLDLYVNLSPVGTKKLDYDFINPDGTDFVEVSLSTDAGLTFTVIDTASVYGAWAHHSKNIGTTTSATCIVRFTALSDYGATDIGLDGVSISMLIADDAGVTAITSPAAAISAGSQNITSSIMNYGTAALTSATINWSVNGVAQTPYSWTGNLLTDSVQSGINLGTYNFTGGTYTISSWTTIPNGSVDGNTINDTTTIVVAVTPAEVGLLNIVAPVSGCGLTNSEVVSVKVVNSGSIPATNIPIFFNTNGILVHDTVTSTMLPGDTLLFTFTNTGNFSNTGLHNITLYTALVGDNNTANDTITAQISKVSDITTFPFTENFNNGYTNYLYTNNTALGFARVDTGFGVSNTACLHFGSNGSGTWTTGTGNTTTPAEAWTTYTDHQGYAVSCNVNAATLNSPELLLDLRQTYINGGGGPKYSWFRVLLNDTIPITGTDTITDYNPTTPNSDVFVTKTFDLSAYANSSFKLTLQSSCKWDVSYDGVGDNVFVDNLIIREKPANDITVVRWETPQSACGLTNSEAVTITVRNVGLNPASNINVKYSVNGGASFTTGIIAGPIAAGDTLAYTFATHANLSTPGLYNCIAQIAWTSDQNAANDTLRYAVTSVPNVTTYPYFQNFDGAFNGWVSRSIAGTPQFALGTPAKTIITTAHSGTNAWVTLLNGNYADNSNSILQGPCFNFTSLTNPQFSAWLFIQSEADYDGMVLEYMVNDSAWIQVVGDAGFYNDATSLGNMTAPFWSGANGGWIKYQTSLTSLAGQSNVKLRFRFESDAYTNDDGIAIDDIRIADPSPDLTISKGIAPTSGCGLTNNESVTIIVRNVSLISASNIPVKYSSNGGVSYVSEIIPGPILANDSIIYTFTASADLSISGIYQCIAIVSLPSDNDNSNDTLRRIIISSSPITTLPYSNDFETADYTFVFRKSTNSNITVPNNVGVNNSHAIHFEGGNAGTWPGGSGNSTISNDAWNIYSDHISSAATCNINAVGMSNLALKLDLRQTHVNGGGPLYSWFRVLANDSIAVADTTGATEFNPVTDTLDPFTTKVFDLSSFAGTNFTLKLEASCKWNDISNGGNGDNVIVDNFVLCDPIVTLNDLGNDTAICLGNTLVLDPGTATGYTYNWTKSPSSASIATSQTYTVSASGTYRVNVYNACGFVNSDSITVTINPIPVADAGADQAICAGTSATLTAVGGTTFDWSDGSTTASINVSPLADATYTVTVTSNGCSSTDAVAITINPLPVADAGIDQTICTTTNAILVATGGTIYDWSTTDTTASITVTPLVSTTYTVTVTNNCGTDADSVIVNTTMVATANAGADQTICAGTIADLGASGGNTYSWSTGASTQNITVTPTQTTTYTVTSTSSCGTASDTVVVTVNPLPIADAGADQTICIGTTADLSALGGTSYSWNTGELTQTISVSPTVNTTYTVVATNSCGTGNDSVVVNVNQLPIANAGTDQIICAGASATLTGTGGISYNWNNGDTTATINVAPTVSTTYTLTITNLCGTGTSAVVVTVNNLPVANAGVDQTICTGASATLTANGGVTYTWSTSDTTASITVSPTQSTTYTVTATTTCGTASDNLVVTVTITPSANAGLDQSICNGSSAILNASGGSSYSWSTGENTASITVSPTQTTTYTVTSTSSCGTASDTVVVSITAPTIADAGLDQNICTGTSATLTATGGTGFDWNTGEITNSISVSPVITTTYTVTVTGTCGTASDAVLVNVTSTPTANAGVDQTICSSQTASLNAFGGVSYNWSSGDTAASIVVNPTNTTTYTVTTTSTCGTASDFVVVTVNPSTVANAGNDQSICAGASASLTATGGNSYSWNTGAATATITVSPSITTTYYVQALGNCGTASDAVVVTVNTNPTANAGVDQTICNGSSATLSVSGGTTYNWSNGLTTSTITVNPTQTTTYSVTATSTCGTASDAVVVTVSTQPIANAGLDQTICIGASAILTATGGSTYNWNTGETTTSISVNPTQTTTYSVTIANTCGIASDAVVVSVNSNPTANAGLDQIICNGQSTTLNASGGATYQWSTGDSTQSIIVNPIVNTTYLVTATSSCGAATDAVVVSISPLPLANAGIDQTVCAGAQVSLSVTGGTTYMWNNGSTAQNTIVSPIVNTTYSVTATNTCGTSADIVVINIINAPMADAGLDATVCSGATASLTANGGQTYTWSNGQSTQTISVSPTNTTVYYVTASNSCGDAVDSVTVNVNNVATASAGADQTVCAGTTVTLSATGGNSYSWSNGANLQTTTANPTITTSFTVTATSQCGSATDNVVVFVNASPMPDAGMDQTICAGSPVSLTANGGLNYEWSNGQITQTITVNPLLTTTYTVTATNICGSAIDNVIVFVNDVPTADAGLDQNVCTGTSVTLTGNGGDTYVWSDGIMLQSTTFTATQTITYTVTVTNSCGTASDYVVVTVDSIPSANAGADQTICAGSLATLGASGGITYVWSNGTTTQTININPVITSTYSVTSTSTCGTATDAVVVFVNDIPTASAGSNQTVCAGSAAILNATGGTSYQWNNGVNTSSISVTPLITTTYTVTVINTCGQSTDAAIIFVNPLPTANAGSDVTICGGSSTQLNATGGTSYNWSSGETTQSISVNPTVETTYLVTATNSCGIATDDVIVHIGTIASADAGLDQTVCVGTSVTLLASGGSTYSWSNGATTASINATPAATTTYSVTTTSSCGTASDAVVVTVSQLPSVNLGSDATTCTGSPLVLDAGAGFYSYSWSTGENTQTITVDATVTVVTPITYTVTVSNYNFCDATDQIVVTFDPCVGIAVVEAKPSINCFPNPTSGILNVVLNGINEANIEYSLIDIQGHIVMKLNSSTTSSQLNLSALPKGFYTLKAVTEKHIMIERVVVD